jgi:hypothetical protein
MTEIVRMHKGQRYVAVGQFDHVTKDGREIQLNGWLSHCAECGRPFVAKMVGEFVFPTRRCERCAKRGVRT